jgi:hypothetical protein
MQTIAVASTKSKRDHRLAELFLKSYKQGQYTACIKWINHSQYKDVEVVGESAAGERLAVEHTLIVNFPDVLRKENFIKTASRTILGDVSLRVPRHIIDVLLPAEALDPSQPWRLTDLDTALACWARASLAALPTGNSTHVIPISAQSGASQSLEIMTVVTEAPEGPGAVFVHGLLPMDFEPVLPALKKAIQGKAPKLLKRVAEKRAGKGVLLLEIHGNVGWQDWVVDHLRADLEIQKLDAVALAYTSGLQLEGEVHFFVWYPCSNEWDAPWIVPLARHQMT